MRRFTSRSNIFYLFLSRRAFFCWVQSASSETFAAHLRHGVYLQMAPFGLTRFIVPRATPTRPAGSAFEIPLRGAETVDMLSLPPTVLNAVIRIDSRH